MSPMTGIVPAPYARAPGVAGAVLAGGASRRMGRDKATLEVGGRPLACRALAAVATVACPVVLVAPAGHPAGVLGARGIPGCPVGLVRDRGAGPLAALAAAFAALDAAHVLVAAGDHPDLRVELLAELVARRHAAAAVACRRGGHLEPLVAVYERAPALAAVDAAAGSPRGLLAALGAQVLEEPAWRRFDPDGASFVDLDDPADLEVWARCDGRRDRP
jgi:molybdopterin-guanine dinucleotide biosynthesis protein A